MQSRLTTLLLAATLLPGAAVAGDFKLTAGTTLTSNYVYVGTTQSANGPAIQGFIEGSKDGFYLGAFLSSVSLAPDSMEADAYLGYRGEAGKLSYDINYTRYAYNSSGLFSNAVYVALSFPVTDKLTLTVKDAYDITNKSNQPTIKAAYAVTSKLSLSATFGHDDLMGVYFGDVGATYALSDKVSIDGRYYKNSSSSGLFAASISFTTDILGGS